MAALGALEAAPLEFESVDDVPQGGVLCALPALLSFGLLKHTRENFVLPKGFYPIETIFLTLAFLALARIRSLEELRYEAPGEWGKLLGFDRVPEVKTLRRKLGALCQAPGRVQTWSSALSKQWMEGFEETTGALYIDGHVRVYHGQLTKLPRRYVARQKLCLRGTTDYWVNAMDGQPFFVVTKPIDPGLLIVLRDEIVPRLLAEMPGQPSKEELARSPLQHRFTLVFDRAGYSPDFFLAMRNLRIAILTYHKFPDLPWNDEEFTERKVTLVHGETVSLALAERGIRFPNGLWVREIRYRDEQGHQTSVLSTDYLSALEFLAAAMFARWCQENFFKYMQDHYGLDRLIEYGTEPLPDSITLVNPAWRGLDSKVRKQAALLARRQAEFGALYLLEAATPEHTNAYEQQKGKLLQTIQAHQLQLDALKSERKQTPKHVTFKDLPQADQFTQLKTDKKHLVDTIKLIAYRAETALALLVREKLPRANHEARAWVRGLFQSAVDLRPDHAAKTLTVSIHRQATAAHDIALDHVCSELNDTETVYPGTELRLIFRPVGSS